MILKTQINLRINAGMNISQSYERVVDSDDEARAAGAEDATAFFAYLEGFTTALPEGSE